MALSTTTAVSTTLPTSAAGASTLTSVVADHDAAARADQPVAITRTVVFTDVVQSTTLIDTIGDIAWLNVVHSHHSLAWSLGRALGAEHVKSTGDGVAAVFGDAETALTFGARMIAGMAAAAAASKCVEVGLKVGVAAGPVHRMFGDHHGRTMHLAARLCAAAGPGTMLVSASCRDTLPGPISVLGESSQVTLPGFAAPEPAHRLTVEPRIASRPDIPYVLCHRTGQEPDRGAHER